MSKKHNFCNVQWLSPATAQTGKAWVDIVNEPCGNCFRTSSLRWKATQINNNKSCYVPIRGLFQKQNKTKRGGRKNLALDTSSHASYQEYPVKPRLGEVALCLLPWLVGHTQAATVWHESQLGMSKRKVRKDMERTRRYGETWQLTRETTLEGLRDITRRSFLQRW